MVSTEERKKLKMTERHQPPPTLTISEILTIADLIYKQTGHYPSYGEVFTGISSGRIKPENYIKRGKKL